MKISQEKCKRISEQILTFLYTNSPKSIFTSHIAKELARDEEFIKKLLKELTSKNLVIEVKKNPKGKPYARRSRWKLSDGVYNMYKKSDTRAF